MRKYEDFIKGLQKDVEVPSDVSQRFSNTLDNLPEVPIGKSKYQNKARKWLTAIASTAAALAIGTGVLVANPVLAAKIPIIGKIFERVEDRVTYSGDYKDKADVLTNEVTNPPGDDRDSATVVETVSDATYVVEDQGVTFTASEVYCDGHSLYLTAKVESKDGGFSDMTGYSSEAEITALSEAVAAGEKVEGERDESVHDVIKHMYAWGGGQTKQGITGENELQSMEGDVIDDNTFVGMLKIDLAEEVSGAGVFDLDLNMLGFDGYHDDRENDNNNIMNRYDGSWKLAIPYTVDTENAKTIDVNQEVVDGFKVNKVFISQYQAIVYLNAPYTMVTAENSDKVFGDLNDEFIASEQEGLSFEESTTEDELKKQEMIADGLVPAEIEDAFSNKYYHEFDLAAFNQDGVKLDWNGATLVGDQWVLKYALKGLDLSKLQLFFSDKTFGVVKTKTPIEAKDNSVWNAEITIQ